MRTLSKDYIIVCVLISVAGLAGLAGCSESQNNTTLFSSPTSNNNQDWQIVVKRFVGPSRRRFAQLIYNSLIAVRGLDKHKVRKIDSDSSSAVVYGRYNGLDDPRAQRDLKFIKSLAVPNQGYPFLDAHLEPVPEPNPPINSQYLLKNATGYWTLQIARFYGKGRKRAAVDMTNELRKKGIPAYVYHGPVISIVTIGAYPENAVKAGRKGKLIGQPIPVNPSLRRWLRKFPYMMINTQYVVFKSNQGKKKSARIASQIIRIPSENGSLW